jgi:hypothetical protein
MAWCSVTAQGHFTFTFIFTMTRLQAGRPAFDSRQGQGFFLLATGLRPAPGSTQSPIQWVPRAPSPGITRPGCEADHLHSRMRLHGMVLS